LVDSVRFAVFAKRLVKVPVVEKRLVEVAWVVVDRVMLLKMFAPVKVLLSVRRVEEAVRSAGHAVLQSPEIHRLVKLPLVEKSEVEVAWVVVERVMLSNI